MWLLYLYFIRDALADIYELSTESFAWAFADADWPQLSSWSRLSGTLENYGMIILANGALLIAWAIYNQIRYGGLDRHVALDPVEPVDLAKLYGVPVSEVAAWQAARILTMRHDSDGTIRNVDVGDGPLRHVADADTEPKAVH